jgi:hypothetical protein
LRKKFHTQSEREREIIGYGHKTWDPWTKEARGEEKIVRTMHET